MDLDATSAPLDPQGLGNAERVGVAPGTAAQSPPMSLWFEYEPTQAAQLYEAVEAGQSAALRMWRALKRKAAARLEETGLAAEMRRELQDCITTSEQKLCQLHGVCEDTEEGTLSRIGFGAFPYLSSRIHMTVSEEPLIAQDHDRVKEEVQRIAMKLRDEERVLPMQSIVDGVAWIGRSWHGRRKDPENRRISAENPYQVPYFQKWQRELLYETGWVPRSPQLFKPFLGEDVEIFRRHGLVTPEGGKGPHTAYWYGDDGEKFRGGIFKKSPDFRAAAQQAFQLCLARHEIKSLIPKYMMYVNVSVRRPEHNWTGGRGFSVAEWPRVFIIDLATGAEVAFAEFRRTQVEANRARHEALREELSRKGRDEASFRPIWREILRLQPSGMDIGTCATVLNLLHAAKAEAARQNPLTYRPTKAAPKNPAEGEIFRKKFLPFMTDLRQCGIEKRIRGDTAGVGAAEEGGAVRCPCVPYLLKRPRQDQ